MAYQLVREQETPTAALYRGPAGQGVAEFKGPPEQVVPVTLADRIVGAVVGAVQGRGVLLRTRVWADWSPTLYTRYKVEVVVYEPQVVAGQRASMSSPFPWLVVSAAIVLLGLVMLTSWQVSRINWGPLGLSGPLLLVALVVLAILFGRRRRG